MPTFQWTLNNTVSGTLVLANDPRGWEDVDLILERKLEFHGVFQEWAFDLQFHCDGGGKEYIDNVYETQGIDALVTLLIEYACDDGTLETLFSGKLNLSKYENTSIDSSEVFTTVQIVRNDITQTILDRQDVKINLNLLTSLDGTALTAYTNAPRSINVSSQTIDLSSEIDGASFTDSNLFDGIVRPQFGIVSEQMYFQPPLPINLDDLTTIGPNPDFHNKQISSTIPPFTIETNLGHFYDSQENVPIRYPETYTVNWDISGTYTDIILTGVQTRSLLARLDLALVYGDEFNTARNDGQVFVIGNIPGYTTGVNPFGPIAFAFAGSTTITLNRGDKIWLCWLTIAGSGYTVLTGAGPFSLQFDFAYTTSQLTLSVSSIITPGTNAGFAIYETWSRVSESITDQVSFAFRSDFYGRTDSQPNVGGAPTYASDGCGGLNFIFSGLSLRGYAKHKLEVPLPDFTSLKELFDSCESVHNIGLGIETFGGQDVVRVEEKDYFYDNTLIISLSSVTNLEWRVDESFVFNEFEIGFEQWEPENFNGLDEINTVHEYNNSITTIKNKLSKLSPIIASGYAIEDIKRIIFDQGKDHKYDNNNFWMAVRRVLMTFAADDNVDFSTTAGIDNPLSRRNIKLTPKHNFLRWLNVIGSGMEKVAGDTWDFREGDANVYFSTTVDPLSGYFGCNGDYTANLLDEDGNIAWDDVNARLNAPLWRPEVYEFDAPLTYTEYKAIRDAPRGFIEFRSGTTGVFKSGFILTLTFKLQGGLTHFKLLRRHT